MKNSLWDFECVVIGGGPGGLVSSLYLKRFARKTLLVHSGISRAAWIPKTHNLIGYASGISGPSLLKRLNTQVNELKLPILEGKAQVFRKGEHGFEIKTPKTTVTAQKVILSTGIQDEQLEIPNINDLRKRGLLRYCPVCDAFEFRGKSLCVFVQDDFGIQKALFLTRFTEKLTIVSIKEFNISPFRKKELAKFKVKVIFAGLESVERSLARTGLWVKVKNHRAMYFQAAYVELGCRVRDEAFKHLHKLKKVKEGFLTVTSEQRLSVPGLFAVGDCVNLLGQISVAAGQAAVAATTIHNDLTALL